jgi:hypothetical protein
MTYNDLLLAVLHGGIKKATKYISEKEVVKATFVGKRRKGSRIKVVVVTSGAPNYEERKYIKRAKREGRKFPLPLAMKSA